jgi:hypothetical protein
VRGLREKFGKSLADAVGRKSTIPDVENSLCFQRAQFSLIWILQIFANFFLADSGDIKGLRGEKFGFPAPPASNF